MTKKINRIQNCDIADLFTTGKAENTGYHGEYIEGNRLYATDRDNNAVLVAVKIGKYVLIDGDEETYDKTANYQGEIQNGTNKHIITVSFECLKNAGMKDIDKIKAINSITDSGKSCSSGQPGFGDFETTVPQGATYRTYGNPLCIKEWHIAGSVLLVYGKITYLCGMDGENYFISKLATSPKTVSSAFRSLKPRRVQTYEKKSGKMAKRQGEWFFIPCPDMIADNMQHNTALPHEKGGNEHAVDSYEQAANGKHYCKGNVDHPEHFSIYLGNDLHEAICNTALASWSVQGVD